MSDLARIEGDEIVIRITIADLPAIVENAAFHNAYPRWRVTNAREFATDLVYALNAEREDGTTRVHLMLDGAINHAAEYGAEGIEPAREAT